MKQELLSIVEIFKEYRRLLFGQQIIVYTDHKNLLLCQLHPQSRNALAPYHRIVQNRY